MSTNQIDSKEWPHYFDKLSDFVQGSEVEIEVFGNEIGVQIEAKSVILQGLSYDQKSQVFIIDTKDHEHVIREPQDIYVDYRNEELKSIKITGQDGNVHIIKLGPK